MVSPYRSPSDYDRMADETRFTCCGGRDVHRATCEYYDELPADEEDVEDDETDDVFTV